MKTITVSKQAARDFLLRAFALETWQSQESVDAAIQQLEFIQEDSINICGRIHELILWPRVKGYAPELLAQALYGSSASAFEIHFPNLSALPRRDYPYFVSRMRERQATPGRWQGLFPQEEAVAEAFLAALDAQGPLSTRSHGNVFGHMLSGWGTRATVVSQVAEKLWLHGKLSIAHRKNFERYFDRTERIAPELAAWHKSDASLPDPSQVARFRALKRLRARRLFRPKKEELALLGKEALCKVEIAGVPRPWFCLKEDADHFIETESQGTFLLAPLDPLIYDRERTRDLFDFDYTWEVYTPEAKRKWGYYVLPILHNGRLVGRLDPKFDRKTGTLHVLSLTLEPHVEALAVAQQLRAFGRFLGTETLHLQSVPQSICNQLAT